jgi:hypothetical protein
MGTQAGLTIPAGQSLVLARPAQASVCHLDDHRDVEHPSLSQPPSQHTRHRRCRRQRNGLAEVKEFCPDLHGVSGVQHTSMALRVGNVNCRAWEVGSGDVGAYRLCRGMLREKDVQETKELKRQAEYPGRSAG